MQLPGAFVKFHPWHNVAERPRAAGLNLAAGTPWAGSHFQERNGMHSHLSQGQPCKLRKSSVYGGPQWKCTRAFKPEA